MDNQNQLYIAIITDGGLIKTVRTGANLQALIQFMDDECAEQFEPETDDARIFDADGNEVYSQPNPGDPETFDGRLIVENQNGQQTATPKRWTLAEIQEAVRNDAAGMIHTHWYTIDGHKYHVAALSIGPDRGVPVENGDGKIVVSTYLRRDLLAEPYRGVGDLMDLVAVDVVIEPEDVEYVSILKKVETYWMDGRPAEIDIEKIECPRCRHPRKAFVWHDPHDSHTKWISCMYCGHEEEYDVPDTDLPDLVVNTKLLENIIEMSRTVQLVLDHKDDYRVNDDNGFDSRVLIGLIPKWAVEFEEMHKWDSEDPHKKYMDGYYDLIDEFIIGKMQELYGIESVTPIH